MNENEQDDSVAQEREHALAGAVGLPGSVSASLSRGQNSASEEIIRKWYAAWENKDLSTFKSLLADKLHFYERGRRRPHQHKTQC